MVSPWPRTFDLKDASYAVFDLVCESWVYHLGLTFAAGQAGAGTPTFAFDHNAKGCGAATGECTVPEGVAPGLELWLKASSPGGGQDWPAVHAIAPERGSGDAYERYYWTPFCPGTHMSSLLPLQFPDLRNYYPPGVVYKGPAEPIECQTFGAASPGGGVPLVGGFVSLCNHPDFEPLFARFPTLRTFLEFMPCWRSSAEPGFWHWVLSTCGHARPVWAAYSAGAGNAAARGALVLTSQGGVGLDGQVLHGIKRGQTLPLADFGAAKVDTNSFTTVLSTVRARSAAAAPRRAGAAASLLLAAAVWLAAGAM
jgi:hypothetical protein